MNPSLIICQNEADGMSERLERPQFMEYSSPTALSALMTPILSSLIWLARLPSLLSSCLIISQQLLYIASTSPSKGRLRSQCLCPYCSTVMEAQAGLKRALVLCKPDESVIQSLHSQSNPFFPCAEFLRAGTIIQLSNLGLESFFAS